MHIDIACSSVKLDITSESPIGPTHSGPETRLSFLLTEYERGKKQCIGRDSIELGGVSLASIEA